MAGLSIMLINVWVKSGTMVFSQHSVPHSVVSQLLTKLLDTSRVLASVLSDTFILVSSS